MKLVENDNTVFFDVDDTLVMWEYTDDQMNQLKKFNCQNLIKMLLPHTAHINLLRSFKSRGYYVVVWSQGGYEWANEVVKVLDLEQHVDLVMSKPRWMVDDIPIGEWSNRLYKGVGEDSNDYEYAADDEPVHCG